MAQDPYTQDSSAHHATRRVRDPRSLATRRAAFAQQVIAAQEAQEAMAIADLEGVSRRMKQLRDRSGLSQYDAAYDMGVRPRTYQSWENGEVETTRANYDKVAAFYAEKVGQPVTSTWILFGQEDEPPISDSPLDFLSAPDVAELQEAVSALDRKLDQVLGRIAALAGEIGKVQRALSAQQESKPRAGRRSGSTGS